MIVTERRTLLLSFLVLGTALSCNSPTLPPLPPPNEPRSIEHVGNGEVELQGSIPVEEAKLLVLNTDNDEIRGMFTHDGFYSVSIPAQPGDFIHLWYSTAGIDSPLARFTIPPLPEGFEEGAEQGSEGPDESPAESSTGGTDCPPPSDAGCTCE